MTYDERGPVILVHIVMDEDHARRVCDGEINRPVENWEYLSTPRMFCPLCQAVVNGWHRAGNECCRIWAEHHDPE